MNIKINTPDDLGGTDKEADYPKIAFWKNANKKICNAAILIACELDTLTDTSKKPDDFVSYL